MTVIIQGQSKPNVLVIVNVEEIRVEQSLNDSSEDGNGLEGSLERGFGEIPVHPVRNIKSSVQSQCGEVMCSNCICFTGSL